MSANPRYSYSSSIGEATVTYVHSIHILLSRRLEQLSLVPRAYSWPLTSSSRRRWRGRGYISRYVAKGSGLTHGHEHQQRDRNSISVNIRCARNVTGPHARRNSLLLAFRECPRWYYNPLPAHAWEYISRGSSTTIRSVACFHAASTRVSFFVRTTGIRRWQGSIRSRCTSVRIVSIDFGCDTLMQRCIARTEYVCVCVCV